MNRTAQIAAGNPVSKVRGSAVVGDANESIGRADGAKKQLKCAAK